MKTDGGGLDQFGLQPNLVPETQTVPEPNKRPPSSEGVSTPAAGSTSPEVPNTLMEAL